MDVLRHKEETRSQETGARQLVSDDGATNPARQTVDIYRQSAKRLLLAVGLLLVVAVVLFAVGLTLAAGVVCFGSVLNAAAAVYLIRAARRLAEYST
jgi:hypothetical protein